MTAVRIDGRAHAARLRSRVATHVSRLSQAGVTPGLAVVLVGDDPASQVYVRSKHRATVEAGMNSFQHRLPATASEAELLTLLYELNQDPAVHGILCQLPLPSHLNDELAIGSIDPQKDVDGFNIQNVGHLTAGLDSMIPCTPLGCMMLIKDHLGSLSGT